MHEGSEANAFLDPWSWERGRRGIIRGILPREAFAFGVIVADFKRAIEQAIQVDVLANNLIGGGRLAFMNKVAAAKFVGS